VRRRRLFVSDSCLISRKVVGSPVLMKVTTMPSVLYQRAYGIYNLYPVHMIKQSSSKHQANIEQTSSKRWANIKQIWSMHKA